MPKVPKKSYLPKETPAFVTGSQAYGQPHSKSDVDLIIFCDERTLWLLKKECDECRDEHTQERDHIDYPHVNSVSIRYGKLNIIACLNRKAYDMWQECTATLMHKAGVGDNPLIMDGRNPITREFACEYIAAKRKEAYGE